MPELDVASATERALEQARRAGLPMTWVTVTDVVRDSNNDWLVTVETLARVYQATIDKATGAIKSWAKTK